MKRSVVVIGCALAFALVASMFAPTPVTRPLQAQARPSRAACEGLRTAYNACRQNNPNSDRCAHIREQLFTHGCLGSSSHQSGK